MINRSMVALETFTYPYGRAQVKKGQKFEAENDRDVEALTLAKLAREDSGDAAKAEKKPGKYKTRDMRA